MEIHVQSCQNTNSSFLQKSSRHSAGAKFLFCRNDELFTCEAPRWRPCWLKNREQIIFFSLSTFRILKNKKGPMQGNRRGWRVKKNLYGSYFAAIKACAQLCMASINILPAARLPFDMPVIEAAAKPLYDLCDFVKQLRQHGVPVSTSWTDAAGSRNYAAMLGLLWSSSLSMRQHLQPPPQNPSKRALHSAEPRLAGLGSVLSRCAVENNHQENKWQKRHWLRGVQEVLGVLSMGRISQGNE